MDLLQNPFYLLGASDRDGRRRIMELGEEKSLFMEADVCHQLSAGLTNPKKRLEAEISWFPGATQEEIIPLITALETDDFESDDLLPSYFSYIGTANFLAAKIAKERKKDVSSLAEDINELASNFDDVTAEDLIDDINEAREESGFPTVSNIELVEEELDRKCEEYLRVIQEVLDELDSRSLVETVTATVNLSTDEGGNPATKIVKVLVDRYETSAQEFLDKEEENIKAVVELIKKNLDENRSVKTQEEVLDFLFEKLKEIVSNWDSVAQPIQVINLSQGINHSRSENLAYSLRSLSIDLHNKYGKTVYSKKLTVFMQKIFEEVLRTSDLLKEDEETLNEMLRHRRRY